MCSWRDIIWRMKILLALIALPLAGLGLSVPQLATSPYADGETATVEGMRPGAVLIAR